MTRITHASRELVERAREISALSRLISATKDSLRSHSFSSFVASRSIASLFRARGLEAGKSCIRAMMHSRTLQGARSRAESEMDGLLISWVISSLAFQPLACYCRAIPLIRIRALRVPIACLFPDPPSIMSIFGLSGTHRTQHASHDKKKRTGSFKLGIMLIGAGAKVGCTHLLLHRSPDAVVDAWGPLHLPPFYFRRMLSPHRRRFFEARFFFRRGLPFWDPCRLCFPFRNFDTFF